MAQSNQSFSWQVDIVSNQIFYVFKLAFAASQRENYSVCSIGSTLIQYTRSPAASSLMNYLNEWITLNTKKSE